MIMMASSPGAPGASPASVSGEFRWIEDEGLLRDEGVLFGLALDEAGLQLKAECIRAYYDCWKAEGARVRDSLKTELDAQEAAAAPAASEGGRREPPGGIDAPAALAVRYGVGIAGAGAACAGTAALVYELLRPGFASPALVTAGVLAAGFFTGSLPVSLLFASDRAERPEAVELWKVRMAELVLPLAVALFVLAWSWERIGAARALATGALLFLVFAFAGRLLLSSIGFLGRAVRAMQRERAQTARDNGDAPAVLRASAMADGIAAKRRELASLRSDAEWDAICAARLALFRSEFELARASRIQRPRSAPAYATASNGGPL